MRHRRKAREAALQVLYYMDMRQNVSMEAFKLFCRCFPQNEKVHPFFEALSLGVMKNRQQIDEVITRFSANWKLSRMSCVDRNIMRIALFELLFCPDIPAKVSINEAVDIGKRYGTIESGAFINGILDSAHIAIQEEIIKPDPEARISIPDIAFASIPPAVDTPNPAPDIQITSVPGRPDVVKRQGTKKRKPAPAIPNFKEHDR